MLGRLRREGLIEIGHRRLSLPNRARAEAAACECHAAVRHHFSEVLGAVYAPGGRMVAVDASEPERLKPPSSAVTLRELAR